MKHIVVGLLTLHLLTTSGCGSGSKVTETTAQLSVKPLKSYQDTFESKSSYWTQEEGNWIFAKGAVTQTETREYFPLLLLKKEKFSDLDVSVEFMPLSGRIDASGGVVFRAADEENYYIVRANALESNFRLYYFKDGSRYQIATATVTSPAMKKFSTIRVLAKGNHIQAYLNGKLEIDYHDNRYTNGYVGLWTKADSVTTFDNLKVEGR